jgi:MFS family permease
MLPRRRPQAFPRQIESHGLIRFRAESDPSDYKDAIRAIEPVACRLSGWYSQRLLSRGVSSRLARGILGGLGVVLGGAALAMLPYVTGTAVKIALTTLGVALPSANYVISNAVVGEITPAAQRRALLAIGTAAASSAGLLAPYIMGSVIESATTPLDGFNTGFFMSGVIILVGGAIAMALVKPEREAKRRSRRLQPLTAFT